MKSMSAGYSRHVLYANELFEIVQCHWSESDSSPVHTHGPSSCYTFFKSGVFENRTNTYIKADLTIHEAGQTLFIPAGSEHEIKCLSKTGETIHVYTPKISEAVQALNFKSSKLDDLKKNLDLDLESKSLRWNELVASVEKIRESSVTTSSPYFMNQLFSGVLPEMVLAEQVIAETRSTMATFEASPAMTLVEMEVVKKLGQLIGWDSRNAEGVSVPGGSAANFMAIHCARQKKFPEAKENGWPANLKAKIFVSEEAHYSFRKACVALGFGNQSVITVATNSQGQMLSSDLKSKIKLHSQENDVPLLVCATAGTTVFGAFDPIEEISEICQQNKIWLHVDAAWGGPALFSKKLKPYVQGIEKVDSVTFDAHKLFGAQLTCSYFLTQDPQILLQANDVSGADYLFHDGNEVIDRGRLSWQCGRKADSLSFWTIWKSNGTDKLGEFVDRLVTVRDETVKWIQTQERLTLLADPQFLNLCVQIKPPEIAKQNKEQLKTWSLHVREQLRDLNQAMVNYSTLKDGTTFLRLILANPQTDFAIVQNILKYSLAVT